MFHLRRGNNSGRTHYDLYFAAHDLCNMQHLAACDKERARLQERAISRNGAIGTGIMDWRRDHRHKSIDCNVPLHFFVFPEFLCSYNPAPRARPSRSYDQRRRRRASHTNRHKIFHDLAHCLSSVSCALSHEGAKIPVRVVQSSPMHWIQCIGNRS